MTQWEYDGFATDGRVAVSWLNEMGLDGWELVNISEAGVCIFKRKIAPVPLYNPIPELIREHFSHDDNACNEMDT